MTTAKQQALELGSWAYLDRMRWPWICMDETNIFTPLLLFPDCLLPAQPGCSLPGGKQALPFFCNFSQRSGQGSLKCRWSLVPSVPALVSPILAVWSIYNSFLVPPLTTSWGRMGGGWPPHLGVFFPYSFILGSSELPLLPTSLFLTLYHGTPSAPKGVFLTWEGLSCPIWGTWGLGNHSCSEACLIGLDLFIFSSPKDS